MLRPFQEPRRCPAFRIFGQTILLGGGCVVSWFVLLCFVAPMLAPRHTIEESLGVGFREMYSTRAPLREKRGSSEIGADDRSVQGPSSLDEIDMHSPHLLFVVAALRASALK